ncbi:Uncharacterised protein [Actinobacillus pleuropneumoniae]|nr:Uncharacterised protein [Actinobacillus pleuropneumoniae]
MAVLLGIHHDANQACHYTRYNRGILGLLYQMGAWRPYFIQLAYSNDFNMKDSGTFSIS